MDYLILSTQILNEALASDFGIKVETLPANEFVIAPALRAKQILYRYKKDNPDFDIIQIRLSPVNPDRELWLLKTLED